MRNYAVMPELNMVFKTVRIHTDTYWKAKRKWGEVSSSMFDEICGIKFVKHDIIYSDVRYLPFNVVDEKRFNYACMKYEFDFKI